MIELTELKLVTASNIINQRTKAGMTQAELGAKLNYSDKSVSKWERGEAIPDAYVLSEMAELFGVTLDELVLGEAQSDGAEGEARGGSAEVQRGYNHRNSDPRDMDDVADSVCGAVAAGYAVVAGVRRGADSVAADVHGAAVRIQADKVSAICDSGIRAEYFLWRYAGCYL